MDIKQSYIHHIVDCIVNQKLLSFSNRRVIKILFEIKKKTDKEIGMNLQQKPSKILAALPLYILSL